MAEKLKVPKIGTSVAFGGQAVGVFSPLSTFLMEGVLGSRNLFSEN